PDEVALAGGTAGGGNRPPEDQLLEAPGLRLLHVREGLLGRLPAGAAGQRELHQALVDLQLVLHEGDLQLLTPQAAAKRLEEALGGPVAVVGGGAPPGGLLDLPLHVMQLEAERGKVEP